jgi:hypothetical protein
MQAQPAVHMCNNDESAMMLAVHTCNNDESAMMLAEF